MMPEIDKTTTQRTVLSAAIESLANADSNLKSLEDKIQTVSEQTNSAEINAAQQRTKAEIAKNKAETAENEYTNVKEHGTADEIAKARKFAEDAAQELSIANSALVEAEKTVLSAKEEERIIAGKIPELRKEFSSALNALTAAEKSAEGSDNAGASISRPGETEKELSQPKVELLPRTYHDEVGYTLTRYTLYGLFGGIIALLCFVAFLPINHYEHITRVEANRLIAECVKVDANKDLCLPARVDLARSVAGDITAHREFWKTMFDKVIGTTLFPLLTALLGYLFGAQGRSFLAQPSADKQNAASK